MRASATRRPCSASARRARSRSESTSARRAWASVPQPSSAPYPTVTRASHQPNEMPSLGRDRPCTTCAAIPAAAVVAATGKPRRWATCSAPRVAGGVAAGDSAASTVSASAPVTGRHSRTGDRRHPSTPDTMSRTGSPRAGRASSRPQIVGATRAAMPAITPATTAARGTRRRTDSASASQWFSPFTGQG